MSGGGPEQADDLAFAGVRRLAALYRSREASPVDVAKAVLSRIDRWNHVVNAYCFLDPQRTLAEARASEARWMKGEPLSVADGVPYGVKDLLLVANCRTGFGSVAGRQLQPSSHDAPSVARLREAGSVFVGKTTTSEFGWKGTADSPLTGIARNPWDPALTTGGSSGGAACAAAAGMGTFQLGTDGAGSTRIPAAFCGIAGMKATFGRVSAWPAGPMLTLSNVGPMARTADDVDVLFEVIAKPDRRDWNSVRAPASSRQDLPNLQTLRIGVYTGEDQCDPGVEAVLLEAVQKLADHGASIEYTKLPLKGALHLLRTHWEAGAAWLEGQVPEDRRHLLDDGLKLAASKGAGLRLADYYDAMVSRQKFGEAMQSHLSQYDLVLTPTVPILPFVAGRESPEGAPSQDWLEWNPFTYPFNLTRQPAISIPAGFHPEGLPVGLQLATGLYEDRWLLNVAKLVEGALDLPVRRPTCPLPIPA